MNFREKHQSANSRREKADKRKVGLILASYSENLESPTQKSFLSQLGDEGVSSATIDQFTNLKFFKETLIEHQLDPQSIKIKKAILYGLSGDNKRNRTLYKGSYKQTDTRRIAIRVSEIVKNNDAFWSLDTNEVPKTISLVVANKTYCVETNEWIAFLEREREHFKQKARDAYRRVFGKDASFSSEPFSFSIWRAHAELRRKDEKRVGELFGSFTQYMHFCGIRTVKNQDKVSTTDLVEFVLEVWECLNVETKSLCDRDLKKYKSLKPDGVYFSLRKFSSFGQTADQGLRNFSQTLGDNIDKGDEEILATLNRLATNNKRAGLYLVKLNETLWKFGCSNGGVSVKNRIINQATERDGRQRDALCKMFATDVEKEEERILKRLRKMIPDTQHVKKEYFHLNEDEAYQIKEFLLNKEGFKVFDQW